MVSISEYTYTVCKGKQAAVQQMPTLSELGVLLHLLAFMCGNENLLYGENIKNITVR